MRVISAVTLCSRAGLCLLGYHVIKIAIVFVIFVRQLPFLALFFATYFSFFLRRRGIILSISTEDIFAIVSRHVLAVDRLFPFLCQNREGELSVAAFVDLDFLVVDAPASYFRVQLRVGKLNRVKNIYIACPAASCVENVAGKETWFRFSPF